MGKRIVFATGNAGKIREIKEILADLTVDGEPVEVMSMKEAGVAVDAEENGSTYEENALIKARAVTGALREKERECEDSLCTDTIVMADDSGLEIDYLNKEPGIYSARYLGEDTSYRIKNKNLIDRLDGVEDEKRTARFVCAIAAVFADGKELTTRGVIEGRIGYEECGEGGFGYDPIFYVPRLHKTTAQLSEEEKNEVSHRGRALRAMKDELRKYM